MKSTLVRDRTSVMCVSIGLSKKNSILRNLLTGWHVAQVYLVRLEGEQTMGFSVQDKDGRFRISHVDEGKAADRAGLTVDQWVVSYKLWPMHRVKHVAPIRAFDPWTAGALDVLNSHPSNEAIAIKAVAPDGFNEACSARMEYIKQAKTSVSDAVTLLCSNYRNH